MPLDDAGEPARGGELIPRAMIAEIVGHRNKALELYAEAFTAIEAADTAIKAANTMADQAAGGVNCYIGDDGRREIEAFREAVKLPDRKLYERVARRLTDLRVWSWVVQRTDLEKLMDAGAKEKLRQQMRYIPAVNPNLSWRDQERQSKGEMITGDEIEAGMPPVTVENIYATLQTFAGDAEHIFRRGVANAFSKLDRRFRSHDGFKIGSRVILTHCFSSYGSLDYGTMRDTLLDIERAFAVIENEGHLHASYGHALWALEKDRRSGHYGPKQSLTETRYFRIRGFKNGNAHLWFTRDDLVIKVNKLLAEWYGEVIGDGNTAEPDIFTDAIKTAPAKRYGFFPTPELAAETVIGAASLRLCPDYKTGITPPPLSILEPSAGTGNLSRLCATIRRSGDREWSEDRKTYVNADLGPYGHQVDCVEIQPELARDLEAEGVYRRVICSDFLKLQPDPRRLYDRVVMNPPFDRERDIDHVFHALKFLKPDGCLVAIMSAGTEFRGTKKAIAFRKLMREMGGRFTDLPAGSFSSVGTNVNTMLVAVGKCAHWDWHWTRFEE